MKRKSVTVTKIDGHEAKEIFEHFGLTRQLDKTQMQLEIAQPEQVKTANVAGFPIFATTVCGDGRDLWLVAQRKSLRGKNEDTLYQVHRPKKTSLQQMQQLLDIVADRLAMPDGGEIRDADLFEF